MGKPSTIDAFFKRKNKAISEGSGHNQTPTIDLETPTNDHRPSKTRRIEHIRVDAASLEANTATHVDIISKVSSIECAGISLERDPGLRPPLSSHPHEKKDEIRRAYLMAGPYRHLMSEYSLSGSEKHRRRFQASWFEKFPWLEYSPSKDAAFCFPCYLFSNNARSSAFTVDGFRKWKKVNDGKNCTFLNHAGKDPTSPHVAAQQDCDNLMNQAQHIQKIVEKQTSVQVVSNRLRLKTSIDAVRWLTFQACAFRGHDESKDSRNRGNFIELIKLLGAYNKNVDEVVLENAPGNAKYISPKIQKEILHIFATKVQRAIREEIGDSKFCIIVDEARNESKREQMALVLRFVDKDGYVKERFFDVVHVSDTSAATLKNELSVVLSRHNLSIKNIRGQGYDGASNMCGEWNGLQALFRIDCPYAYYIHCFAHRLQLALVAASKQVYPIYHFFSTLTSLVNIVGASCKRHDELQAAQAAELELLLSIDELETGKGQNQIGTLKRAGDTRWSSHLNSICSLLNMYNATCLVLKKISKDGSTFPQRAEAEKAYNDLTSFEFIFILHLKKF